MGLLSAIKGTVKKVLNVVAAATYKPTTGAQVITTALNKPALTKALQITPSQTTKSIIAGGLVAGAIANPVLVGSVAKPILQSLVPTTAKQVLAAAIVYPAIGGVVLTSPTVRKSITSLINPFENIERGKELGKFIEKPAGFLENLDKDKAVDIGLKTLLLGTGAGLVAGTVYGMSKIGDVFKGDNKNVDTRNLVKDVPFKGDNKNVDTRNLVKDVPFKGDNKNVDTRNLVKDVPIAPGTPTSQALPVTPATQTVQAGGTKVSPRRRTKRSQAVIQRNYQRVNVIVSNRHTHNKYLKESCLSC